uniref:Uncharacterized protein n=1 Tax=Avena sativa TaxID=4498 RepID=A0ACD5Z816_AVESA
MYPTNHYMDPYYSYCRDHPPYLYYPPPSWEAGHPQTAMNSAYRPPSHGPLPYSGSTSHSHLPESHSCCNKTYPPGYYSFRPPFSQELPPPHLYYHGPLPHHLNTYPSYFVPPPPYHVDQIPYGYGKFNGHCCGCPNHVCHGGEKSILKIEEEMPEVKPDIDKKGADNSSITGHPSYQYPAMRLPSGNLKDNVKGRSFEMPPQLFSKWLPESGEWTGNGKQQSNENNNARQFQWPVIWMPRGYDEPKQESKEFKDVDQSPKVAKEAPRSPDVKIIPLSWFENDHNDQKPVAREGSGEHNGRSSVTNQSPGVEHRHDMAVDRTSKTIPVVPGEIKNENKPAENNGKAISVVPDKEGDEKKVRTCRTIPVMVQKENGEEASNIEEGENRKSNSVEKSKAKISKLPPVCLRVDPLPRKKSGNRSSGSLNPVTKKVCEKENHMKEAQSKNQEAKLSEPNKGTQNKQSNVPVKEKSSEVDKRIRSRNVTVQDASVKPVQEEEICTKVDKKVEPSINVQAQENTSAGSLQDWDKSIGADDANLQGKASKSAHEINLSAPDAAIRIQSAYRGYVVRRWQPLEKLRKVKKVHEQMQDLNKQLQGLEASSKQLTVKEQVAMNETIMNLLLNLDSIQGLPCVRETRKSVARELVCLQEKLDSLCKQVPSEPNHFRSEKEESVRTDNDIQTTAHVSTAEASEEVKFAAVVEELGMSAVNSSEMMNDEVSSGTPKETRQDAGLSENKHEMEESSTTHEGKAASPGECQGTSLMDSMCDAAFSGHSTEQKSHTEESNTMSNEDSSKKEEDTANGEGHDLSSVDCEDSLYDERSPEELSTLEQSSASTGHNSCTEESNTGASSPGTTEDGTAAMATLSRQSVASVDQDGMAGQVWQSADLQRSALKPNDDATATEDETSVQSAQPDVCLKGPELHEHDPHLTSIAFSRGDRPEEAPGADAQNQVADTMQDSSAKEPDGTPEPTVADTDGAAEGRVWHSADLQSSVLNPDDATATEDETSVQFGQPCICLKGPEHLASIEFSPGDRPGEARGSDVQNQVADTMQDSSAKEPDGTPVPTVGDTIGVGCVRTATAENKVQSPLLEETPRSSSALQQSSLQESEAVEQREVCYKEEPAVVDQPNETCQENPVGGGSSIGEKHEAISVENEAKTRENTPHDSTVPSNMSAEPSTPENVSNESPCDQDGTMPLENPDSKMPLESQSHTRKEDLSGDKTSECDEMAPEEASVYATEPHPAELPTDNPKEDAGIKMAPEEAANVSPTQGAVNNDEKNLADENLELKEMLQKLLSSGNDQLGVITELSEKVKSLERKLARKRPKVKVCRPARNATASLH